eukprot:RCo032278
MEVLSWGVCTHGETGHGLLPEAKVEEPTPVEELSGKRILQISSMNYHSLALTEEGEVFAWGHNGWRQCGSNGSGSDGLMNVMVSPPEAVPIPLKDPKAHVVQAECGGYHCLVLASDGTVYSWGRNTFGQLGLGHTNLPDTPQLVRALVGRPVAYVKAGRSFSVALTEEGEVLCWGLGMHGQLGTGSLANGLFPARVGGPLAALPVLRGQCGNRHCCALAESGDVYYWGQSYDTKE